MILIPVIILIRIWSHHLSIGWQGNMIDTQDNLLKEYYVYYPQCYQELHDPFRLIFPGPVFLPYPSISIKLNLAPDSGINLYLGVINLE